MICASFFIGLFVGAVLLLVPGYLLARCFLADKGASLCLAPAISTALYNILAVVYSLLGVSCGVLTLVLPLTAFLGIALFIARRSGASLRALPAFGDDMGARPFRAVRLSWAGFSVLAGVLCSAAIAVVLYLSNIGSPSSYLPFYDNAYHLTRLREFVDSGVYSSFFGGFYPSAWHCLGALIMSTTGCEITVAAQCSTMVYVIFAFPLGMCLLLATLFPRNPHRVFLGSLLCLCTWFFPWKILLFGPLYPNVASFTLMPSALALFIVLFGKEGAVKDRLVVFILFVLSGVALVFAQPNTVFFAYLVLVPYLMMRVREAVSGRFAGKRGIAGGLVAESLLLVGALALWYVLLSLPFMQALVEYERDQLYTFLEAVPKLLTFQFVIWRPQYLLCVLLCVGAARLLLDKKTRWFVLSYGVVGFVYLASVGLSGRLRGYIAGFCYNDYYRTAACVCVVAVPLVATGAEAIVAALSNVALSVRPANSRRVRAVVACVLTGLLVGFNYFPLFDIPRFASWGFDTIAYWVDKSFNDSDSYYYTSEEEEFVCRAKEICGTDLVVNQPYDGSVFSYAIDSLNVLFPQYGFDQEEDKATLKLRLGYIAQDQEVAEAARRLGVKYVLQLDQGSGPCGMSPDATYYDFSYDADCWVGINMITDDTPGFEVVLSEGNMRLYRIAL